MHHYTITKNIDALHVTETWLSDTDSDKIWLQATDVNKKDLSLFSFDRKERGGGGLGLIIRNIYNTTTIVQGELCTFQFAKWKTKINHTALPTVEV